MVTVQSMGLVENVNVANISISSLQVFASATSVSNAAKKQKAS